MLHCIVPQRGACRGGRCLRPTCAAAHGCQRRRQRRRSRALAMFGMGAQRHAGATQRTRRGMATRSKVRSETSAMAGDGVRAAAARVARVAVAAAACRGGCGGVSGRSRLDREGTERGGTVVAEVQGTGWCAAGASPEQQACRALRSGTQSRADGCVRRRAPAARAQKRSQRARTRDVLSLPPPRSLNPPPPPQQPACPVLLARRVGGLVCTPKEAVPRWQRCARSTDADVIAALSPPAPTPTYKRA